LQRLSIAVAVHCVRHHAIGKAAIWQIDDLSMALPDGCGIHQLSHLKNDTGIVYREFKLYKWRFVVDKKSVAVRPSLGVCKP